MDEREEILMCGIGGILNLDGTPIHIEKLNRIERALWHRGPDDGGVYVSADQDNALQWKIGLTNRRLSIIDLDGGRQPMCNSDGSVWIVYNGEIYNYRELRKVLLKKGRHFMTSSDTEVVLQAYEEYGVESVDYLEGMFAFAIWDSVEGRLFLDKH